MDRMAIIRTEAQRLADALAVTAPDARCPTCPDWSASDLLWHLTEVHLFWAGVLSHDARTDADIEAVEKSKPHRPTAMAGLLALRERATTALLDQLARLDDDEPRWTWGWLPDGATYEPRAVVEFLASDADKRWLVEVGVASDRPRAVRATTGEPTATVSAPVVDLALWAWTRGDAVQISGGATSVAALDAVVNNGMQ